MEWADLGIESAVCGSVVTPDDVGETEDVDVTQATVEEFLQASVDVLAGSKTLEASRGIPEINGGFM